MQLFEFDCLSQRLATRFHAVDLIIIIYNEQIEHSFIFHVQKSSKAAYLLILNVFRDCCVMKTACTNNAQLLVLKGLSCGRKLACTSNAQLLVLKRLTCVMKTARTNSAQLSSSGYYFICFDYCHEIQSNAILIYVCPPGLIQHIFPANIFRY